jgi:Serine dehydratase beta chain
MHQIGPMKAFLFRNALLDFSIHTKFVPVTVFASLVWTGRDRITEKALTSGLAEESRAHRSTGRTAPRRSFLQSPAATMTAGPDTTVRASACSF